MGDCAFLQIVLFHYTKQRVIGTIFDLFVLTGGCKLLDWSQFDTYLTRGIMGVCLLLTTVEIMAFHNTSGSIVLSLLNMYHEMTKIIDPLFTLKCTWYLFGELKLKSTTDIIIGGKVWGEELTTSQSILR